MYYVLHNMSSTYIHVHDMYVCTVLLLLLLLLLYYYLLLLLLLLLLYMMCVLFDTAYNLHRRVSYVSCVKFIDICVVDSIFILLL